MENSNTSSHTSPERQRPSGEEHQQGGPPPFLVAAVGASAGGVEALTKLVENLPGDSPLALVLVQHLPADHKSLLADILDGRTSLIVREATDDVAMEAGHVYVVPPGSDITAVDGHLRLSPRRRAKRQPAQIDRLFKSVADQYGQRAIGVVLSGFAEDGAAGLLDIKAAGGVTIAQSPGEAKISGMPLAAIATGAVDLILPVEEIAQELRRLASRPPFAAAAPAANGASTSPSPSPGPSPLSPVAAAMPARWMAHDDLSAPGAEEIDGDGTHPHLAAGAEQLAPLFRLLRRSFGVDLANYKLPTVLRRIQRRMAMNHVGSIPEYCELLQKKPSELEELQEDVLIHVTAFFREPESFGTLQETVFPEIIRQCVDRSIRIWVPGCSSGEEVYSLAIALLESLSKVAHSCESLQIFGTDVSERSINKARAAIYPSSIVADVSPERLRRFFVKTDDGYRIAKAIREYCVFARQDTTRDPPFSKLDLIVCRNVLIYLAQPVQRKLIRVFHYALRPEGFLMLGRAETTGPEAGLFALKNKRFKIYAKLAGGGNVSPSLEFATRSLPSGITKRAETGRSGLALPQSDLIVEVDRLLLSRYAPPAILLDDDLRIVRTRGRTGPFLELPEGEATLDVLRMVKKGLAFAVRTALEEARRTKAPVRKDGVDAARDGVGRTVTVEVVPYLRGEAQFFLLIFESRDQAPAPAENQVAGSGKSGNKRRGRKTTAAVDGAVEQLQRELAVSSQELEANIRDLAAANEELQSANEEVRSSNEELQSTNEELDTAKEELQSTNEELSTLNEELHGRNEELTQANADLANFLSNVDIPIVMISSDLRIRRFTPAAEKVLNLIASDTGRPIGHIKPNINYPDLERFIAEVIRTGVSAERDVEDGEGNIYSLRIRPYRSAGNSVTGAVLSLVDISAAKKALRRATEMGDALMYAVGDPILLLDADLKVQRANTALYDTFRMPPHEMEGRAVFDLGGGQWDIPELRHMLEAVRRGDKHIGGVRIEREFQGVGWKKLLLDARRLDEGKPGVGGVLLIIREERENGR